MPQRPRTSARRLHARTATQLKSSAILPSKDFHARLVYQKDTPIASSTSRSDATDATSSCPLQASKPPVNRRQWPEWSHFRLHHRQKAKSSRKKSYSQRQHLTAYQSTALSKTSRRDIPRRMERSIAARLAASTTGRRVHSRTDLTTTHSTANRSITHQRHRHGHRSQRRLRMKRSRGLCRTAAQTQSPDQYTVRAIAKTWAFHIRLDRS